MEKLSVMKSGCQTHAFPTPSPLHLTALSLASSHTLTTAWPSSPARWAAASLEAAPRACLLQSLHYPWFRRGFRPSRSWPLVNLSWRCRGSHHQGQTVLTYGNYTVNVTYVLNNVLFILAAFIGFIFGKEITSRYWFDWNNDVSLQYMTRWSSRGSLLPAQFKPFFNDKWDSKTVQMAHAFPKHWINL